MHRHGKGFIIPSLELDITHLCSACKFVFLLLNNNIQSFMYFNVAGLCTVCQHLMGYVCNDCSNQANEMKFYCSTCSPHWHHYYCDHQHFLHTHDFDTGTLQLLSVLCIQNSHYVCFTRITGSGNDEWVFFDSAAERQGNTESFMYT